MLSNVKTCGVTWCKYVSDVVPVANKNVHLLGFARARDAGESIKPAAQAPGNNSKKNEPAREAGASRAVARSRGLGKIFIN